MSTILAALAGLPLKVKIGVPALIAVGWIVWNLINPRYGDDRVDPLPWAAPPPAASIRPTLPMLDGTEAKQLAAQFQPSVHLDHDDGFAPVAVEMPFQLTTPSGRRGVCLSRTGFGFDKLGDKCPILSRIAELADHRAKLGEEWAVDFAPAGLSGIENAIKDLPRRIGALVSPDPAPMYFHAVPGPNGTIGLQYWFFYPFNYQPVFDPLRLGGLGLPQIRWNRLGQHEGDFESIAVLLSAKLQPVYVWMARHDSEGQRFAWEEGVLDRPTPGDSHLDVYAARGSHATYEFCSRKARQEKDPVPLPDDICRPDFKITPLRGGETPLVDLARTSWACWTGRFGWSPAKGTVGKTLDGDGPLMPLWQQDKFGDDAEPCDEVGPPANRDRDAIEMPDDERARTLRERSGRVNGAFARCADWNQAVRAGAYVVACSDAELTRFVRSGLSVDGGPCVRFVIAESDTACRSPQTVPAVYHASNEAQLDGLRLTADDDTRVDVYAGTRGSGRDEVVAFFEDVSVGPGRMLTVERTDDGWQILEDKRVVDTPVEARTFRRHRPPGELSAVSATRRNDGIDVTFTSKGGTDRLRYAVALSPGRDQLSDEPLVVKTFAPARQGKTRTVRMPDAAAAWVRVSAHRDGMSTSKDVRIGSAPDEGL